MSDNNIAVWLVDDDASIRWVLEQSLRDAGMRPTSFEGAGGFLSALKRRRPDVVITDIRMPGMSGLDLLAELRATEPELPVIVTTAHSDLDSAVDSFKAGAFDYLPKPFDVDEAVELVRRAAGHNADDTGAVRSTALHNIIGQAPAMQAVYRAIGRLSGSSMTVLITGESGTGKELVARALHEHSPRKDKPFVALNSSAIPAELLESELFGHERGAFTGADRRRIGRFEQADGGTLFLDEIGDMPATLQTRLLRVLAEGEFYRVGGQEAIRVDTRIVAATHQDLEARVAQERFREDLYHRLNVVQIHSPALRERREDLDALLVHYLATAAREMATPVKTLSPAANEALHAFDWPGNVRQLVNLCRRLTALAPGREIGLADLPHELHNDPAAPADWSGDLASWARARLAAGDTAIARVAQRRLERVLIDAALERTGGRKKKAAELLGWGRNTLTRKLKELSG